MVKYMTLPDNWHSKKYGFEFVEIINRVVEKELTSELTNAAFYTLTINETTDIFVNKGLIVYFKFRPNNFDIQYIVIYGGIIQLEACDSNTIVHDIKKFYTKHQLNLGKMVMFTSVGALVMLGRHNRAAAQLKKKISHLT